VTLIDKIREAAKKARSKHTENAASQLAEEKPRRVFGYWIFSTRWNQQSSLRMVETKNSQSKRAGRKRMKRTKGRRDSRRLRMSTSSPASG
jgi:hypothetical protein